jgi:hypothetical protein
MNQENTPLRKNLKLALLAGTCLSSTVPLANAATVVETTDFSNTLAGALGSPLPVGTDQVIGTVTSSTDLSDFVTFTNLLAGSAFTMSFVAGSNFFSIDVLNSSGTHVGSPGGPISGASGTNNFTGVVPSDGKLVAQVGYSEGNPYTINLTATTVPEPNAALLAGLGVTAALRRNRRKKESS